MATNQGLLQAQIKVKNTIDLNNAFSSPSVVNPQLKSIEGDLNLSNEYALQSFNSSNTNTQHIDTIRTNSSNTSLKEALNNLPNLKYVRLEGNYESKGNSFDNNTNLQKVDLSESLQVKPEDFKANENLKTLPNLDYSNPDLTNIVTNDTNLLPTTFDISDEPNTNKLGIHGDSTHQLGNLEFVKVNTEAPFDNQITPQIDTSYTSLDRNGLVNLFNTMPYNVGYTMVGSPTITDGIVSNFSGTDYVITSQVLETGQQNTFEFKTKFVKMASGSLPLFLNAGRFICSEASGQSPYIALRNSGEEQSSPSTWIAFKGTSAQAFDINIPYWIKTGHDGLYIYLDVSTDGTNYTNWISVPTKVSSGAAADWAAPTVTGSPQTALGFAPSNYYLHGIMDLNETYIKINSQVSTGPVDYAIVGSPTITDDVVSGFAAGNFIRTENDADFSQPFDISVSCIKGTGRNHGIFSRRTRNNGVAVAFPYNNTCRISLYLNNSTIYEETETMDFSLQENAKYIMNFSFDGNDKYYFAVLNGITKAVLYSRTITESTKLGNAGVTFGGTLSDRLYNIWTGSIDLNNTYIKVNGKLWFGHESKQVTWFNGKPSQIKVVDVSEATGTSSLINDDKAIVTNKGWRLVTDGSNSKNYIIEDGKLIWANPGLYLSGPVNYNITGSPTIVDGIASGFSSSDYLSLINQQLISDITDFESVIKFTTNTLNIRQGLGGITDGYGGCYITADNRLRIIVVDFINKKYLDARTEFYVSANTTYYVKNIFRNGKTYYSYSQDGINYTTAEVSATNDLPGNVTTLNNYRFGYGGGSVFLGSIDLNETYIKVNGQLWFYGKNYATQNIAPVPAGFTFGGTITSSIGYVDMRTQQFTAAPEGTTYGWDLE